MNRHAPDAILLDAAKVVELAERIDQKKRDRLLFRLAREVLRSDEVIASMGYQIMMLENHLLSARASAKYWQDCAPMTTKYRMTSDEGKPMSDTPRTDKACRMVSQLSPQTQTVPADFARQLERELGVALNAIRQLSDQLSGADTPKSGTTRIRQG